MEVKIGIQSVPREIVVDTDLSADDVEGAVTKALSAADGHAVLALSTLKGGRVLVPADKIAFVEFSGDQSRRIGFA